MCLPSTAASTASSIVSEASTRAANWLAGALVVLPFLQLLPLDFDRTAVLLLVPAIWFGQEQFTAGCCRIWHGGRGLRLCSAVVAIGVLISVIRSDQPAPALVATASWIVIASGAVLAGELLREDPRKSDRLLAGLAIGGAAGIVFTWYIWMKNGKGITPVYAHPRLLGLHLVGGVLAATALVIQSGASRNKRLIWVIVGILSWAGLLWSGGRTPIIAVAAGLSVWLIKIPRTTRLRLVGWSIILVFAGLVGSAFFWTSRPELGWWHALDRTKVSIEAGSVSALSTTRTDFWRETVERAELAPWFGHGPDSYRFINPKLDGQQPHNVILQLWLDLGLFGAVPALILLVLALISGWQNVHHDKLPWLALLTASSAAGMLDGAFYHVLALLPVALALGIFLMPISPRRFETSPEKTLLSTGVTALAMVVLLFHSWLFYEVSVAEPPAGPYLARAQILRWFPSTTYGLWRWLDAWQPADPASSLAWARWAQLHSSFTPLFHIYAARCYLLQGERSEAQHEIDAAIKTAHYTARPQLIELKKNLGLDEPITKPSLSPNPAQKN